MFPLLNFLLLLLACSAAALSEPEDNNCTNSSISLQTSLDISIKTSCLQVVELAGNNPAYLFFELLQLKPKDKLTYKQQNGSDPPKPLNVTGLPILVVTKNITLTFELDKEDQDYRIIKAVLLPTCDHTHNITGTDQKLRLQSPTTDSLLNCTVGLNISSAKLSLSLSFSKLAQKSSVYVEHANSNNKSHVVPDDRCDFIEESGMQLLFSTTKDDAVLVEVEPVDESCSREVNLDDKDNKPLSLNATGESGLECRVVVHNHHFSGLAAMLDKVVGSQGGDGSLQLHRGGSRLAPTLVLAGQASLDSLDGQYWVLDNSSQANPSLLLRMRHLSLDLHVNASNSVGYVDTEKQVKLGADSLYLLELGKNKVVLVETYNLTAPLSIYSDFRDSAHLLTLPAGPLGYPLVSPTSRLMVRSSAPTILNISSSPTGCDKMSLGSADTFTPVCQPECEWVVPPRQDSGELALHVPRVNLANGEQALLYLLGSPSPLVELRAPIREMLLPPKKGFRLVVHRNCSAKSGGGLEASYDLRPSCSEPVTVKPGEKGQTLVSPNYPDHYPLNSECSRRVNTSGSVLLVTLDRLDLAKGHHLELDMGNKTLNLAEGQPDILVKSSTAHLYLAAPVGASQESAPGYNLTVTAASCGQAMNEVGTEGGSLQVPANATSCLWTLNLMSNKSVVNLTWILAPLPDKASLEIYDGPSLRSPLLNTSLSRTPQLVLRYLAPPNTPAFTLLNFTTYLCTNFCANSLCKHPGWDCNGVNDCGDWSDELHCNGTVPHPSPAPQPAPAPSGWSSGSFAAAILLSLIVGLSLTYAIPIIYNRYRSTNYEPFASNLE